MSSHRTRTRRVAALSAPFLTLLLAACGSTATDAQKAAPAAAAGASSGAPAPGASTDAKAVIDKLAAGYESQPPSSGPAPAKGKKVWWISCGQSIPDCAVPAGAAQEAAAKLGFDFHIADGKLNVGGGNAAAIRTALATGPDAIVLHGMSCSTNQQPIQEAKAAGVLVMGVEGLDCSDEGGQKYFTAPMQYSESAKSVIDYFKAWGTLGAKYAAAVTDGQVKAINNAGIEPLQKVQAAGFVEGLAQCSTCTIVSTVSYGSPDYGPSGAWIQQYRTALAAHPEANATVYPTDAMMTFSGGTTAVRDSGRKMVQVGGTGGSTGVDLVRSGQMTAITGAHDPKWMGYGAMDNLNRALNGQPAVPEGIGAVVVDKDHNLPAKPGSDYQSKVDYIAAYTKIWSP